MHIEVQVALNFVISYLYNKLPRRRVNIFGEELEKALKDKFKGHWYPEKPFKGSAFRCIKTGDPMDSVFERAAMESGIAVQDVFENLPRELAVWVDPGEVSYRIGETSSIKILYSEVADASDESSADHEVTKTFNPEAQSFRPIEVIGTSLSGLSLSPRATSPFRIASSSASNLISTSNNTNLSGQNTNSSAPSPIVLTNTIKESPSPVPSFVPRPSAPLTFTTATFAQTKFGSTKLKTSSKRANRMSPTEFSNYIKQRAMQQQMHHQQHQIQTSPSGSLVVSQSSPNGRSMSPTLNSLAHGGLSGQQHTDGTYFSYQSNTYVPQYQHRCLFDSSANSSATASVPNAHVGYVTATSADFYPHSKFSSTFLDPSSINSQFYGNIGTGSGMSKTSHTLGPIGSSVTNNSVSQQHPTDKASLQEGLNNFGMNSVISYPASQYQHLLVAN